MSSSLVPCVVSLVLSTLPNSSLSDRFTISSFLYPRSSRLTPHSPLSPLPSHPTSIDLSPDGRVYEGDWASDKKHGQVGAVGWCGVL